MTKKILGFVGKEPGLSIVVGANGAGKTRLLQEIERMILCRFVTSRDKKDVPICGGKGFMGFAVRELSKEPSKLEEINSVAKLIIPNFGSFGLTPDADEEKRIYYKIPESRYSNGWRNDSITRLSDGMIQFISIWGVLNRDNDDCRVILIDDIEQGLHPKALPIVASMLRIAAKKDRVIVTTHSPLLLNEFEPSNIAVLDSYDQDPAIRFLKTEDYAGWLEEYSVGDLWLKNILGGRP